MGIGHVGEVLGHPTERQRSAEGGVADLQRIVLKVHDIRSSVFRFIRVDQFGAGFDFPIH